MIDASSAPPLACSPSSTPGPSSSSTPHVHCLVTGGGVPADGRQWHPARKALLVPVKALAKLVRGKLSAMFRKSRPDLVLPAAAWSKPWVVHCTVWGEGEQAALDYLARYVFRVALTNSRMVGLDDHGVTLRYKKRTSNRWRTCRSTGEELLRRVLRHVLPKGLHKVRDFGLWPPAKHALAARARLLLLLDRPATPRQAEITQDAAALPADHTGPAKPPICLYCNDGRLVRVGRLRPKQAIGP